MLGQSVKIFRWTPWFKPGLESPMVPLWFSIPHLPACLFSPGSLASIASGLGRLLKIGPATRKLGRIEAARICVEVDVSKPIPSEIWISLGADGFIQEIIPDYIPPFCSSCRKHGHFANSCIVVKAPTQTEIPGKVPDDVIPKETSGVAVRRRRTRWTPVKQQLGKENPKPGDASCMGFDSCPQSNKQVTTLDIPEEGQGMFISLWGNSSMKRL